MEKKERIDFIYELVQRWGKTDEAICEEFNKSHDSQISPETIFFPIYAPNYGWRTKYHHERIYGLAYDPVSKKKLVCTHHDEYADKYYIPMKLLESLVEHPERYSYERIRGHFDRADEEFLGSGKNLLRDVIYSAILDGKVCNPKSPNFNDERNEIKELIKEECGVMGLFSHNKEMIEKWEKATEWCFNEGKRETIFDKIKKSIVDVIKKKYDGKLNLPVPMTLTGRPDIALDETGGDWMVCCDSIRVGGDSLILYMGKEADQVHGGGTYGIDFLLTLNDLVGGPNFEIDKWGNFKRGIDMIDIENASKKEVLNRLFDAYGGKEMPFKGTLHGIRGYYCDKLIREGNQYIAEYEIVDPNAEHNPKLREKVSIEDIEKAGGDLLQRAKSYNEEFSNQEGSVSRFQGALESLMPNVYEEIVLKNEIDVQNLDDVLTYYKIANKIKELKNKGQMQSGNITDAPHAKTQILREVAKGNVSPEKGVTKRKRSNDYKKTVKTILDKKMKEYK